MRYFAGIVGCALSFVFFGWLGLAAAILVSSTVLAFAPGKSAFWERLNVGGESENSGWNQGTQREEVVISDVAFRSFFQAAGHIAKSDGKVSAEEINLATQVMTRLSLTSSYREIAVDCFNEGKSSSFDLNRCLNRLQSTVGVNRIAGLVLFEALVEMSEADGLTEAKVGVLLLYARAVGVRQQEAQAFILQRQHNRQTYDRSGYQRPVQDRSADELANAYRVLGVDSTDSDSSIKMAYRRLMQESHPDRLHAMNLPEFLMDAAHKKTQDIQAAWETVKRVRGIT